MSYKVQDLLNDISSVTHGTTANKIPNIFGHINRAARTVLLDVDPKETQKLGTITGVISTTFDYSVPTDLKGDKVIDIRPLTDRSASDVFSQLYSQKFDTTKALLGGETFNVQWQGGVKSIRINAPQLTTATDYQIVYYSKYLFRNPNTNVFQETVVDVATDANTIINLDTDSYNLLFNKTAYFVAQALQGADSSYDATFFDTEYTTSLQKYKNLNPSEEVVKTESYYRPKSRRRIS